MLNEIAKRPWRGRLLAGVAASCLLLGACATTDPQLNAAESVAGEEGETYQSLLRIADATRGAGDLNAAVGLYRRANALRPTKAEPLVKLGALLVDLRSFDEAMRTLQRALEFEPNNTEALRSLGNAYVGLDRPNLATPHLHKAVALAPADYRLYNTLGVAYDMTGDHREAQVQYKRGLAVAPENLSLRNNLGLSLALSGDYDDAISMLRPLAMHPNATARNRQNLALIYGLAGDHDAAARVGRIDLSERDVSHNLAYYRILRLLSEEARRAALDAVPAGADAGARTPPGS